MNKAVFFDRDGVVNIEKNYIYKIEDFEFVNGVFELMIYFQNMGYLIFIITNQAGIARGYYSEEDYLKLTEWMRVEFMKKGIRITDVYHDSTHPVYGIGERKINSFFRKPNPGMILLAKQEHNIDLQNSILIGDKTSDIEAGIKSGIKTNILVRPNSLNIFEEVISKIE